jgi:ubiquitin carboxyl-terminal hydrolase 4/11/15
MRNDSIIIDNLCGQFKSKIYCYDCGKIQIKFEPYLALSVPIPL